MSIDVSIDVAALNFLALLMLLLSHKLRSSRLRRSSESESMPEEDEDEAARPPMLMLTETISATALPVAMSRWELHFFNICVGVNGDISEVGVVSEIEVDFRILGSSFRYFSIS